MKIAIISDIHENFAHLNWALEQARAHGATELFCLGDLINPGVARVLATCGLPCHMVWGNNDGDKVLITKFSLAADSQLTVSDKTYDIVARDGRRFFLTHYDMLAQPMAQSGDFDAVFYGHNHIQFHGRHAACHIINPGELSGHLTGRVTFALYDTAANDVTFIEK